MSGNRALRRVVAAIVALALLAGAFVALGGIDYVRRLIYPLRYADEIALASERYDVDPYLIAAIIETESGFEPRVESSAGAVGLMQLMPATAEELAVEATGYPASQERLFEPAYNIDLGTRYVAKLIEDHGTTELALLAYNAGGTHARRWEEAAGDRPVLDVVEYPESKAYVERVLSVRDVYAELYPDAF